MHPLSLFPPAERKTALSRSALVLREPQAGAAVKPLKRDPASRLTGADRLTGNTGRDTLEGRGGDDDLFASGDGQRDQVKCGDGTDTAKVDLNDVVDDQLVSSVVALPGGVVSILSCETVRVGLLE